MFFCGFLYLLSLNCFYLSAAYGIGTGRDYLLFLFGFVLWDVLLYFTSGARQEDLKRSNIIDIRRHTNIHTARNYVCITKL